MHIRASGMGSSTDAITLPLSVCPRGKGPHCSAPDPAVTPVPATSLGIGAVLLSPGSGPPQRGGTSCAHTVQLSARDWHSPHERESAVQPSLTRRLEPWQPGRAHLCLGTLPGWPGRSPLMHLCQPKSHPPFKPGPQSPAPRTECQPPISPRPPHFPTCPDLHHPFPCCALSCPSPSPHVLHYQLAKSSSAVTFLMKLFCLHV